MQKNEFECDENLNDSNEFDQFEMSNSQNLIDVVVLICQKWIENDIKNCFEYLILSKISYFLQIFDEIKIFEILIFFELNLSNFDF